MARTERSQSADTTGHPATTARRSASLWSLRLPLLVESERVENGAKELPRPPRRRDEPRHVRERLARPDGAKELVAHGVLAERLGQVQRDDGAGNAERRPHEHGAPRFDNGRFPVGAREGPPDETGAAFAHDHVVESG